MPAWPGLPVRAKAAQAALMFRAAWNRSGRRPASGLVSGWSNLKAISIACAAFVGYATPGATGTSDSYANWYM